MKELRQVYKQYRIMTARLASSWPGIALYA